MRVGPVEIEDYTPELWRVTLIIDETYCLDYCYAKNFNGYHDEMNNLKQFVKDLKARHRGQPIFLLGHYPNTFNIMDFVREIEYSIPFMEACYDETNDG